MRIFLLLILSLVGMLLPACTQTDNSVEGPVDIETLDETINVQTAQALLNHEDVVFIDVREQWEYDQGHIPGINLIPLSEFEGRVSEVPTDKTVILTCRSGNRSGQADAYLRSLGYDNIHNMSGGIVAWEQAGFDVEQ